MGSFVSGDRSLLVKSHGGWWLIHSPQTSQATAALAGHGLFYRDVEELLAERGIVIDLVTIFRWVQRFTPLLIDAARPCRHACGDRWFVDVMIVLQARRASAIV
jgi:hypothetical protein